MTAVDDVTTAPTMHGGLANLDAERSYWLDDIDGVVPTDLEGTFYRNGPGRQRIGETPYGHWFDGCGMLSVFSISDGKVHFTNRYVRTDKYVRETAAQEICYRGFGTQIPGGLVRNIGRMPANPANTNTVLHAGKLLALYEGGRPWEVDPATLHTVGEYTYDGALTKANVFSAHGHLHGPTGHYVNFGAGSMGLGWKGPKLCFNIFRIDAAGKMVAKGQVPIDHFPFAHDFALSAKFAIMFVNSITMGSIGSVMLGRRPLSEGVRFDDTIPMQIAIVDLDTMAEVRRIETDPGAIIHFGNAFDDGDEIVLDAFYTDNFDANDALSDIFNAKQLKGGTFRRYRLNVKTGEMSYEQMSPTNSEFPTFNQRKACRPHDVTYSAASVENGSDSFFNSIQRVTFDGDISLTTLPPGCYGSEPVFAPARDSDSDEDGYLLEVVYNGHDHLSELQIYRAADIGQPAATLRLRHHLPHQFHGHWHDEVLLDVARH